MGEDSNLQIAVIAMSVVVLVTLLVNSVLTETSFLVLWGIFHLVILRRSTALRQEPVVGGCSGTRISAYAVSGVRVNRHEC